MRKNILNANRFLSLFAMVVVLACSSSAFGNATIVIVNADGANEGFNDPTPVAPVGGNPGTTRGQQRLNAFSHAASIWGAELDSNVIIRIQASFDPLGANVLGSAGATYRVRDFGGVGLFPGSEFPATWYFAALADKRAGTETLSIPNFPDIVAQFSSNFNFYLGLDNNHGAQNDLVAVLLHEFGHGLNFANAVNEATGQNAGITATFPNGFTDIYARHTLDTTSGLTWNLMTNAQRQASAVNLDHVVWTGGAVAAGVPLVLSYGVPQLVITSPAGIAGVYRLGAADFGAALTGPGITGTVVRALDAADAAGPTTFDACSPLTNAAAVAGNVALVDRGTCGFPIKVKNAQNAGAIAVIVADNVAGSPPPGMSGVDPTITIPSGRVTLATGDAIKANLGGGVTANLSLDLSRRAGTDSAGRALLYAPTPVSLASSISHWDVVASRNLLMEPAISSDLTHNVKAPHDLTLELLRDVGWFADADLDGMADADDCEANSNFAPTVVIDGCDSGVTNFLFTSGCTFSDLINHIAESSNNHGQFVAQVNQLLNQMKKQGLITDAQKDILSSCAGGAKIP